MIFDDMADKNQTVMRLIGESKTSLDYFFLLFISTLITTMGIILNNSSVVIGGMLISPLMTPLLAFGLSIITNNKTAIVRASINLGKSMGIVLLISFLTAFMLGVKDANANEITLRTTVKLPYLYIAILSGIAATYAWVKPKISASLPGIAVAIALVPPLCVTGIGLFLFDHAILTGSLQLFFINALGIIFSATIIFSLFGFHEMKYREEIELVKEELEEIRNKPPKSSSEIVN
ncbi:TIGR00341 family protein [Patescibacteria group bacterium]